MKANYNKLQSYITEVLPPPEQLKEIIIFGAFEVEEILEEEGEIIFDVKVLPDRRADVYDELGLAREICGLLSLHMKDPDDYYTPSDCILVFTVKDINEKLGTDLSITDIQNILDRYHYQYEITDDTIKLSIPAQRPDIIDIHDMLEEIGRPYGYNNIEPKLLPVQEVYHDATYLKIQDIKSDMLSKGFYEIYGYSFVKKGYYEVARAAIGKSALRTNLLDGLKNSYEMNRLNKDFLEIDNLKIFEVGNIFTADGEFTHIAWINGKESGEMNIDEYIIEGDAELPVLKNNQFIPWSEYPAITRDVAVWVPSDISVEDVREMILPLCGQYLVRGPRLFDTFSKDGKTSYAFRMVFQAPDKTLTESDITPIIENIYTSLQNAGYEIR